MGFGNTFSITVSATDPDGDKLSYLWQQVEGPTGGLIPEGPTAKFTIPSLQKLQEMGYINLENNRIGVVHIFPEIQKYVVQVTVSDGMGGGVTTVSVTITAYNSISNNYSIRRNFWIEKYFGRFYGLSQQRNRC
jgi:hypothetical protein